MKTGCYDLGSEHYDYDMYHINQHRLTLRSKWVFKTFYLLLRKNGARYRYHNCVREAGFRSSCGLCIVACSDVQSIAVNLIGRMTLLYTVGPLPDIV